MKEHRDGSRRIPRSLERDPGASGDIYPGPQPTLGYPPDVPRDSQNATNFKVFLDRGNMLLLERFLSLLWG